MAGKIISGKPSRPTVTIPEQKTTEGSMFKWFSEDNVSRKWQVKSKSLSLSEIEEFEDNVRKLFDEEEMTALADSIESNGITEEIWVFHIREGDRYIIADGHRRKKAIERVFWPDHRVEVIVRKEYDRYDDEVKRQLIKIGISTSSLKAKLTNYEEMESIDKYVKCLDELYPDKAPHLVTQKSVYTDFGFTKAKAMKLGKIMATISPEQRVRFQDKDISLRMLDAIAKLFPVADKDAQDVILSVVESGKIDSVGDLKNMLDIRTEIAEVVPEDTENREQVIQELTEQKFKQEKQEQEEMKPLSTETEEDRYMKTFRSAIKSIEKAIMKYDFSALSKDHKKEVQRNFRQLQNLLEETGILPKSDWGDKNISN